MMSRLLKMNMYSECLSASIRDVKGFTESTSDGKKTYYIEGCFAQAEKLNRNGRIYPKEVLFPDIERYREEYVNKGLAWGELDHPEKRVTVNMKEVSHRIVSLDFQGNDVYGKAIIGGPYGEAVQKLIDCGGQLAVSTRGLGKAREEGDTEIMEIYYMTAIDIVSHPSGIDCFVDGVKEGVDYLVETNFLSKTKAFKILNESDKRVSVSEFSKIVNSMLKGIKDHG